MTFVQTPTSGIFNGESFGLQLELVDFFDQRVVVSSSLFLKAAIFF